MVLNRLEFADKVRKICDLLDGVEPNDAVNLLASAVITVAMDRVPGAPLPEFMHAVVDAIEDGTDRCDIIYVRELTQ